MKSILDFVSPSYDGLKGRESIEWANFWYSQSNAIPQPSGRILLIGDSTARMVRSTFERQQEVPVDMIGSSCGLHDILFLRQVDAFFTSASYRYTAIFIQMGHHSIRGESGELYGVDDYKRFRQDYVGLIDYLKQFSDNIILLTNFLNVTPIPPKFDSIVLNIPILLYRKIFGEKIDYSWSDIVIRKNEIIEEIAKTAGLKFCDIDKYMREGCNGLFPRFIHKDHIHYWGRKAKCAIVKEYAKYL